MFLSTFSALGKVCTACVLPNLHFGTEKVGDSGGCLGGFSAAEKGKSQVAKPTVPLPTENSKQPLQQ